MLVELSCNASMESQLTRLLLVDASNFPTPPVPSFYYFWQLEVGIILWNDPCTYQWTSPCDSSLLFFLLLEGSADCVQLWWVRLLCFQCSSKLSLSLWTLASSRTVWNKLHFLKIMPLWRTTFPLPLCCPTPKLIHLHSVMHAVLGNSPPSSAYCNQMSLKADGPSIFWIQFSRAPLLLNPHRRQFCSSKQRTRGSLVSVQGVTPHGRSLSLGHGEYTFPVTYHATICIHLSRLSSPIVTMHCDPQWNTKSRAHGS